MRSAEAEGDRERYSEANRDLHESVLRISGTRLAPEIVRRLYAQNARYRIRLSAQPHRPSVSLPEHLRIIDAICARDPEEAASAMQAHLDSVQRATREHFASTK